MATITGCAASGAQLQSTDAGTDGAADDSLDNLLKKAQEEQDPALPSALAWLPPLPARAPERATLTPKSGEQEKPQWKESRRCNADDGRLSVTSEKRAMPRAEETRITLPHPHRAAAPLPPHVASPLLHPHIALSPESALPLMPPDAPQPPTDDTGMDTPQGVPWGKVTSDALSRPLPPEVPAAPRQAKQAFPLAVPSVLPAAKTADEAQSRISYPFRSWGSEHRVELTSLRRDHPSPTVLLTPSDPLVNRRLQEGMANQPLGVSLVLHDDGDGGQQQQQGDQPPDAEDEA